MKDMRWKHPNCFSLNYWYQSEAVAKKASNRKQIIIELPDEDAIDLLPSREVTQELLDMLDEG